MKVHSLRPERSASANSATSALMLTYFKPLVLFVKATK